MQDQRGIYRFRRFDPHAKEGVAIEQLNCSLMPSLNVLGTNDKHEIVCPVLYIGVLKPEGWPLSKKSAVPSQPSERVNPSAV